MDAVIALLGRIRGGGEVVVGCYIILCMQTRLLLVGID
jgi:hypothetical protein